MWPDVDAAPAPLAAPAARGGEGDIALGNARARVAAGVLSGHVDVTGAVPADARVIASITLTGPAATAELGTSLLVFEPSGSGWTLDQVTVPNAGAMHALRPPFARGIAATFDGQHLAFRVPARTRGACCYRVSVVVSGPSGGGGRASLPALLTTPSLALAGHTVRQPTPGVAVGRTLVARHGALVRGVIALRRDPNAPAVGYIVRLLAPNGGVRGTFSVVFGRSGGGRRLPTTASAQIAQADGTTRTIDLLAAHVRGLSLSYAGGRSRFVVPLPGLRADACCWTASIGALDSSGSPRGGFVDTPARKLAR
jgi:hypothetical protein